MISKKFEIRGWRPRIWNFSRSLEQFFLTVGQNNFGNKIPIFFLFSGRKPRKPRLGSPHPNSLNNSANNRRLHSANRRRSSPNISNQSFSENNNNNYSNPNRKFSRATSYAESFQGSIHHTVSPILFINFFNNFSKFEHLKKKRNFLLVQNSLFFLSLPFRKEFITNAY